MRSSNISRRTFVKETALAAAVAMAGHSFSQPSSTPAVAAKKIKLGFDNFSVRALKWDADRLIDYTADLKLDVLFITDLDAYRSLDENYLRELRRKAAGGGIEIYAGTWSICPGSKFFKPRWGTAEEHLALGIRVAKALGSPVLRCILGMGPDRESDGGIKARIAETVKVCKACRSRAIDAGVKIAIENHGGDMLAGELAGLIEEAGKDYVGATIDSGNAPWIMEDPLDNLEILAPYAVASHMRDTMVWESQNGATVQWVAMGDGNVDFKTYVKRYAELCPGVPFCVETISGHPREIPFLKKDCWKTFPDVRASDFSRFLALAKTGKPAPSRDKTPEPEFQKSELERSLKYCGETLGLGLKRQGFTPPK